MRVLLLLATLVALPLVAWAAPEVKNSNVSTLTFQDGRQPAADSEFFRDTYISEADTSLNHGAADSMRVAGSANAATFKAGINRVLIHADLQAMLPDSAEIRRCRFCLYQLLGGTGTATDTLEMVRLLNPWNEGTGDDDGTAQAANADWNNRTGLAWATAGASSQVAGNTYAGGWRTATDSSSTNPTWVGTDSLSHYNAAKTTADILGSGPWFIAKTGAGGINPVGWVCVDITQDARNVQSGAYGDFYGWLIRTHNNANNKRFVYATSEHPYKVIRPFMEIDFVDLTVAEEEAEVASGGGINSFGGGGGFGDN